MGIRGLFLLLGFTLTLAAGPAAALVALEAHFDSGTEGFVYQDDTFRGGNAPGYASGSWDSGVGFAGGGLRVDLGGLDGSDIDDMSGGFQIGFNLAASEPLELVLRYRLTQSGTYESNEWSQVMVELDGALLGTGNADFVAEMKGDGNTGPVRGTDWRIFRIDLGTLASGPHTLVVGGYNNRKTLADETTEIALDDVVVATPAPPAPDLSVEALVDGLDAARFEQNVSTLVNFGTRHWSQPGNSNALDWIEAELASYGYAVERHAYTFSGQTRENVYATKVGATSPDEMYIVSGHMDTINLETGDQTNSPGADDDASGTSLVLEVARAFAPATVQTDTSVRFILWNNEETGLNGSAAYVADRRALQGVESPPGSGQYPEPTWLGVYQHDMILFDHGLPPGAQQIPGADIDIEYQSGGDFVGGAVDLAGAAFGANQRYATDYPAEVSANMNNTDSKSFWGDCPAVSLRENRRLAEIGNGANPHWHQLSDVVSTYSADDFRLGFNTVQTTTGAVAELSGAVVLDLCGNSVVETGETCDDGNDVDGDGCNAGCQVEACSNGIDDDGDGLVDLGDDPGCEDAADLSERGPGLACDDGQDTDGDGDFDYPDDPGCLGIEGREGPACDDGLDNDGDGAIDWDGGGQGAADPQCGVAWSNQERRNGRRCGLGFELVGVLPLLVALRRRRR